VSAEKGSSLFWFLISMIFLIGAVRLGVGNLHMPGAGFTPFGAAVLLGLLSIINFIQAAARGKSGYFHGTFWLRVVFVFIVLFICSILPHWGYITTFSDGLSFLDRRKAEIVEGDPMPCRRR
jgi:hypothetical protein